MCYYFMKLNNLLVMQGQADFKIKDKKLNMVTTHNTTTSVACKYFNYLNVKYCNKNTSRSHMIHMNEIH